MKQILRDCGKQSSRSSQIETSKVGYIALFENFRNTKIIPYQQMKQKNWTALWLGFLLSNMSAIHLSKFVETGKKIAGAGLNYKALLALKNVPKPEKPVIFLKPPSCYITEGQNIEIPHILTDVHEEIELGIVIGKKCKNVSESVAMEYVGGYCLALDMTEAAIMQEVRGKGMPWTFGKGFDTACPVSRFITRDEVPNPGNVRIWCKVNGEMRQDSNTSDLLFSVPALISYISQFMTLEPCDMILTGSPPGMGPVVPGDVIQGGIDDVGKGNILSFKFPVKEG